MSERLQLDSAISPYLGFGEYMSVDDVAVAPTYLSLEIGGSSAKVVAVEIGGRWVRDQDQRVKDNWAILDPATSSARRDALIEKYGADWLVIEDERAGEFLDLIPGSVLRGHVDRFAVIALPG